MTDSKLSGVGPSPDPHSLNGVFKTLRRIAIASIRTPLTSLGALLVLMFLVFAFAGDWVAPYAYDEDAFSNSELKRFTEPNCSVGTFLQSLVKENSCTHPFGTDRLGHDVYSRVIHGSREIFRIAGIGTLVAVTIGSIIGLLIGYYGGVVDEIVGRLLDSLMSIPVLLLALVLLGSIRDGDNSIQIVLMIVYSPIVARVVRSSVLDIKTRGFVEAAKLRGESTPYILVREIFPSVVPSLVVEASLRFSYAIFLVASLGFLGLGADPPTPNWGKMVFEAYNTFEYKLAPWTLTYPAATIAVLVVSVNLMSDGLKRIVQRS